MNSAHPYFSELQLMVEHHLCKQQGDDEEEDGAEAQESHSPRCCPHASTEPAHSPESCPLAQAHVQLESQEEPHSGLEEREYGPTSVGQARHPWSISLVPTANEERSLSRLLQDLTPS